MNERLRKFNNERRKRLRGLNYEWYSPKSIFGCANWAYFYILLGAREAGKSYSVMNYCLKQWKNKKKPFIWIRLTEASTKKMLTNNAAKMVDPDLYRKYDLELKVKGDVVYDHDEKMATVLALSTAFNSKGVAEFDSEYTGGYTIVIDEFQLEKGQRRTFDVCYNLVVQLENLVRSTKKDIKIIFIGNTTEEASDILCMFNFIPEEFGRYKLKSKKCVIDYLEPTQTYLDRRKGTVGDILAGKTSNYQNKIDVDTTLIHKGRLQSPKYVIKFTKETSDWFTVWSGNVITKYNKEKKMAVPMRRYLDEFFDPERRDLIFAQYDARAFKFKNLITQKQFAYQLSLIKKQ